MNSDTVHWRADGTPASPRYGDIYRSSGTDGRGGLAQAREVFLRGCDLLATETAPAAWAGAPRWLVLETGFGLGLNFLASWLAWRQDPLRPRQLFYTAIEAHVAEAPDLLRSAAPFPELHDLARELARQWHGLLPGVHRLGFDQGHVQLTLAVGSAPHVLAELTGAHDAIYLDGFDPALNPQMWSRDTLRAVARLARPGARAASWCVARAVRERLADCGFAVQRVAGLPPKRHALRACFQPRWSANTPRDLAQPGRCAVIGGGLAGASVAYSLAQRGWHVTVHDRAPDPATGASGLPAGVVAPHVSPDDRPLSRLTRAGVRSTLERARLLLHEGTDFAVTGVLERHEAGKRRLPASWQDSAGSPAACAESLDAAQSLTRQQAAAACVPLDEQQRALWHGQGGWVKPGELVRALLRAPGITWQGARAVARIEPGVHGWVLRDAVGQMVGEADLVVVCAGFDSLALSGGTLPLHALRGQVAHGPMPGGALDARLPLFPVNGHGSLTTHVPAAGGARWILGSTFDRGNTQASCSAADHASNRERLHALLPATAALLDAQWDDGRAQVWAGVRATLPDRLPAVGALAARRLADPASNRAVAPAHQALAAIDREAKPGLLPLHVCTGLGARGLTLAVLCGELLAATLHAEPLPVERTLAQALRADRFAA